MRSTFLSMLWSGRTRPPRASTQERIAQTALRTSWDVKATPQRPPSTEDRPFWRAGVRSWR